MTEDWAAVAKAIDMRVRELGWRQRELAERSHVSQATVRELQHHVIERRRSARTLEALSTTLGWHPRHLLAVLQNRTPPHPDEPADDGHELAYRLDALEQRLAEITDRLEDVQTSLATVVEHIRPKR
ncbi:helix-turn-helix transcriptional regulator [Amycolatopsis sp. NPDC051372]|uniref:helix-turn-helix domain-containing protein n=1 Tax=Amycolatopsis sp. NPDC051372 TaxID=3155669 RepID=UPI00341F662E